jgi:hypothetical protein
MKPPDFNIAVAQLAPDPGLKMGRQQVQVQVKVKMYVVYFSFGSRALVRGSGNPLSCFYSNGRRLKLILMPIGIVSQRERTCRGDLNGGAD